VTFFQKFIGADAANDCVSCPALIIAPMTTIKEERNGLRAAVLGRFHHGFKTPAGTAE